MANASSVENMDSVGGMSGWAVAGVGGVRSGNLTGNSGLSLQCHVLFCRSLTDIHCVQRGDELHVSMDPNSSHRELTPHGYIDRVMRMKKMSQW